MPKRLLLGGAAAFLLVVGTLAPSAGARTDAVERLQFIWPVRGTVTARYGEWRGSRRHEGVDIGMLRSLGVKAAAGGRVVAAGYANGYSGYGEVIVVRVARRYQVVYAHLARVRVRKGQIVLPGQRIGVAGCTGSCSGTHLHFELRDRGRPVDPAPYLRGLG